MRILALLAALCHVVQGGILIPVPVADVRPGVKPDPGPLTNLVFSNADGTIGRWSFNGLQGRLEEATYLTNPRPPVGPPPIGIPVADPVAGVRDPNGIPVAGGAKTRTGIVFGTTQRIGGPGPAPDGVIPDPLGFTLTDFRLLCLSYCGTLQIQFEFAVRVNDDQPLRNFNPVLDFEGSIGRNVSERFAYVLTGGFFSDVRSIRTAADLSAAPIGKAINRVVGALDGPFGGNGTPKATFARQDVPLFDLPKAGESSNYTLPIVAIGPPLSNGTEPRFAPIGFGGRFTLTLYEMKAGDELLLPSSLTIRDRQLPVVGPSPILVIDPLPCAKCLASPAPLPPVTSSVVPEPSTWLMVGGSLALVCAMRRLRP